MTTASQHAQAGELPASGMPSRSSEESRALGKACRTRVPRESHASWQPVGVRADPVAMLEEQARTWIPELAPIRYGRMAASPFSFYRGSAAIMAADLKDTPRSGLPVQLCGDAHLGNFGGFAVSGHEMLFDICDFDETLPGPWEWDIKRLATSVQIAGQGRGCDVKESRALVLAAVSAYRRGIQEFASLPNLDVWYTQLDMAGVKRRWGHELRLPELKGLEKESSRPWARDNVRVLEKLTVRKGGRLRISSHLPLVVPLEELFPETMRQEYEECARLFIDRIRQKMPRHIQSLMQRFKYLHMARRMVGVGSVGPSIWIILLIGRDEQDLLFLQAREAQASVLEPYLGNSPYANCGERVVEGQRLMQAISDVFVGWERGPGPNDAQRDFCVRQLRDWRTPADVETLPMRELLLFGQVCGWTLARAHARSGDCVAIGGYLGKGPVFDQAIAQFAADYAVQNERNHQALCAAIAGGRITAQMGV